MFVVRMKNDFHSGDFKSSKMLASTLNFNAFHFVKGVAEGGQGIRLKVKGK